MSDGTIVFVFFPVAAYSDLATASLVTACPAARKTPPMILDMEPLPSEPKTLMLAALATPYLREPTMPAQWVP